MFLCRCGGFIAPTSTGVLAAEAYAATRRVDSRGRPTRSHDMGVLYGRGGRDLMAALESANSPAGHAVLMIAAGTIGAWVCFYRAALVEDDERARRKP